MEYRSKREAAQAWVRCFDAIPTRMFGDYCSVYRSDVVEIIDIGDDLLELEAVELPMWGTMWSFDERVDEDWLEGGWGYYAQNEGIKKMLELGFRLYRSDEYGYFFGIDGAGFDFYEAFWIPLYEARGMHWHKEDEA